MQSSRSTCSRWLQRAFQMSTGPSRSELPVYLCPRLLENFLVPGSPFQRSFQRRYVSHLGGQETPGTHTAITATSVPPSLMSPAHTESPSERPLPQQCHGCGALTQTSLPDQPGYYNLSRKAVQSYLGLLKREARPRKHDDIVQEALGRLNLDGMGDMGVELKSLMDTYSDQSARWASEGELSTPPLCDRCHNLVHHHKGNSVYHPTIESLRATIEESPYKYNHVYHVIDAADFPLSLLPGINKLADIMPLRSQNRRSKSGRYTRGQKTEMSFIITRSDILAPQKWQVDALRPYLQEVLRNSLGRLGKNVRLGNVRCVSAKRGWGVKDLKEEIWDRGGAGWLVGKANVGKSQLFRSVFPVGRMSATPPPKHTIAVPVYPTARSSPGSREDGLEGMPTSGPEVSSLLPPPRIETDYPSMPVVSELPGTTASPIRVPFGRGKGELIDLPGLQRSELEMHVREEHRLSLLMQSRIVPEQQVLKPGKSLLLGGFIRLTPKNPDLVFLAYAFTPLTPHLTSTEKAISIQEQREDAPNIDNISLPGTGEKIQRAGSFQVRYDVTKQRAGPLTRKEAVNLKVDQLPFRVLGIDILIEGCGWVEVVAQVRSRQLFSKKRNLNTTPSDGPQVEGQKKPWNPDRVEFLDLSEPEPEPDSVSGEPDWPVIDVYTPEGKFVSSRKPMNGYLLNKPKMKSSKRPRQSMKGAKKREKLARRAEEAAVGSP
ncbi:hypothetical protein VTK73DRAFT_4777 [Phialemonium thermophilum]|uniref:Genetic interactor of prohibitins 3, mitochondrial n=1 Tax=Phialemonium thermophilum TaxID=223376 RepID=A0ABR3XZJ9_9PEZI